MQSFITELLQICIQHPLKEKVVIVDSHLIGEQMNEAFIKAGHFSINLTFKTIHDLALETLLLNKKENFQLLEPTLGAHFTYTILKSLKEQYKLNYFSKMEITPTFSHAIYETIQSLRLAGYTANNLNQEAFLIQKKAEDFIEILSSYEQYLISNKRMDEAALLHEAVPFASNDEHAIIILQSNLQLTYYSELFLKKIIAEGVYKLPLTPVFGVKAPEKSNVQSIVWGKPSPFSYLYQLEDATIHPNLSIFKAKTEELEVKQIFRKIKIEEIPFDEAVVYYTNPDPYITYFYHFSQKLAVPITFAEGLPISFSRPGRLLAGLLKWMRTNYAVQTFIELLNEGLFALGEGAPSKSRVAKLLRKSEVGWNQDRYLTQLTAEIEKVQVKLQDAEEERQATYDRTISELVWLKQWFTSLFKRLPKFEQTIHYKHILTGLSFVIKEHCRINSPLDEAARTRLLEEIASILPYADENYSSYEVMEKVRDLLLSIRVNQSRQKPGHLHIASYQSGVYASRQNVFIIGLDNRKFPGSVRIDPLLLDAERKKLSHHLPLLKEIPQTNFYTLVQLLAHCTYNVSVSYCDFNINENRVVSPAHLFLQCFRLSSGHHEAEFKDLSSIKSTVISDEIFEEKDYWRKQMLLSPSPIIEEGLFHYFKNIQDGLYAETQRKEGEFTSFDGLVNLSEFPIKADRPMSAGRLEHVAKCPFSYFLNEILGIRPIEDRSFDAYRWFDAATRGSLLHSIFETFYKKLLETNEKPSYQNHEAEIVSLATTIIEEQKRLLPPPSERVFNNEKSDLLECCRFFLKEEEEHSQHYQPIHLEYRFGVDGIDPANISLPSGHELKVSGIVDRVDQTSNGKYHIIDYKTGSTYGYGKNAVFKGGRQLQHFVYALAIEEHLKLEAGMVEESSYYFPTVKGLADRFTRVQDETLRSNGISLLARLIAIIETGNFVMTDDENDCTYCDFKQACRRGYYQPETLEWKHSGQMLKGVRAYE